MIQISHQNENRIRPMLWKILQGMGVCFFLCVHYTIKRILKTKIFTCMFLSVCVYTLHIYILYNIFLSKIKQNSYDAVTNQSIAASQVSPDHNKQFCR